MYNQSIHCIKIMSGIVFTTLIFICIFNVMVDPYDIFGTSEKRRPQDLIDLSYLTKAVGIIHHKPDTILIGSSIVDAGFALPGSMTVFDDDKFDEKKRRLTFRIGQNIQIYNSGIRGAGLYDIYDFIQHAYANNPKLKRIILGLEWNLFTSARKADVKVPTTPALGKKSVPISLYVNNILSWHATCDSFRTLYVIGKNKLHSVNIGPNHTEIDVVQELKNKFDGLKNKYYVFLNQKFHRFSVKAIRFNDYEAKIIQGQDEHQAAAVLFSMWAISAQKASLEANNPVANFNPDAFECLKRIVAFAKEKNIELDVYVSPQHGAYWETIKRFGLSEYVDKWLKELAQITSYWDFSSKIDFSQTVDNYFNTDALHFNSNAGEIILPSILQKKECPDIRFVNANNVDSSIRERHFALSSWVRNNGYLQDIFAHENFIKGEKFNGDLERVTFYQYRPGYQGYHIFKFMDKFIALPYSHSPYDFRKLFTEKYPGSITGNSIAEIVTVINQRKSNPILMAKTKL